jgi:hypothetical protein
MSDTQNTTVVHLTARDVTVVTPAGTDQRVMTLAWWTRDPFAILLTQEEHPDIWMFSRELVSAAINAPSALIGYGDVVVQADPDVDAFLIKLTGLLDGVETTATLSFRYGFVDEFLSRVNDTLPLAPTSVWTAAELGREAAAFLASC